MASCSFIVQSEDFLAPFVKHGLEQFVKMNNNGIFEILKGHFLAHRNILNSDDFSQYRFVYADRVWPERYYIHRFAIPDVVTPEILEEMYQFCAVDDEMYIPGSVSDGCKFPVDSMNCCGDYYVSMRQCGYDQLYQYRVYKYSEMLNALDSVANTNERLVMSFPKLSSYEFTMTSSGSTSSEWFPGYAISYATDHATFMAHVRVRKY